MGTGSCLEEVGRMSSTVKSANSDQQKMDYYLQSMKRKFESDARDLEQRNLQEIQTMMESHSIKLGQLRHAYDVQISKEAEQLESKLGELREAQKTQLTQAQLDAERQVGEARQQGKDRINEERMEGERRIAEIRKQQSETAQALEIQGRRSQGAKKV